MGRQVIEIVDELVELAMKTRCENFWLHDVDGEPTKIARAVCNADSRAENERSHRVCQWIFNAHPYLVRQLSVFYRLPTEGYT
jgi:hypothetical protein